MGLKIPPEWTPRQRAAYLFVRELKGFQGEDFASGLDDAQWELRQHYQQLSYFYQPHEQLPPAGQRLWRELDDALERSDSPDKELRKALEEFCQWLVDNYDLAETTKEGQKKSPLQAEEAGDVQQPPWADKLNDTQKAIMEVIGETPLLGKQIAAKTKLDYDNVRKHLSLLIKMGAIKRHGSGRGYYK